MLSKHGETEEVSQEILFYWFWFYSKGEQGVRLSAEHPNLWLQWQIAATPPQAVLQASLHDSGCWCKDSACCNHVSVRHNQYVDQLLTLVVWSSKYYDGSRGSCPDWDQPGFPVWPPQSLSSFVWIHIILAGLMMTLFFWVCKETESVTVARGLAERTSWFEDMFMGRLESTPARVYWGRQCDQERWAHNGRLFVSVCVSTLHLHLS